jgi:hypothetical protein
MEATSCHERLYHATLERKGIAKPTLLAACLRWIDLLWQKQIQ